MSVFGTSLRDTRITSAEAKGVVGKAFRGLVAGTAFSLGAALALGMSTAPANAATLALWTTLTGDTAENYLEIWTGASNGDTEVELRFSGDNTFEILTNTFFEFAGLLAPSAVTYISGVVPNSTNAGDDCCTVLGNAWDANINFAPPEQDGATYFTTGLTSLYLFEDILPESFLSASAVAHVQRVGSDLEDSDWLGGNGTPPPIPLPPAALLFLTGLAGMGLLARRRRAKLGGAAA